MFNKIWNKLITTVTGGAVLIAFFSILAKLVGLLRDRILASTFGAGRTLDIYYASFRLPDFIFNTLVLGALAAAFIPVFIRLWDIDKNKAYELVNIVITKLVIILSLLAVIAIIFAPSIVGVLAPGFDLASQQQTVTLTRIMLISIIFFGISNVFSGTLNAWRDFVPYAIAPIFYNVGIIVGVLLLYPSFGLKGLASGVVLGSILHLLTQYPSVRKHGWKYGFTVKNTVETTRMFWLMLPRTIGLAANQINQVVITSIASTLTIGSIAVFNLASNLQSFPISIFGLSFAIAAFPVMSRACTSENKQDFRGSFSITFRRILFFIIPISVLILVLRAQIVRVVLGAGVFDWEDTYFTAQILGVFSISLFAQGTIPLLARAFYAFENTVIPVAIGIVSVIINIVLSIYLSPSMGIIGLGVAFTVANIVNMLALLIVLRERVGDLDDKTIIKSVFKISINSILAGLTTYGLLNLIAPAVNMQSFLGIFIQALLAGIGGMIVYFLLSAFTNMSEMKVITDFVRSYIKPLLKRNGSV
ncbi:MAG: murein biosynthesis integral membrane protein MurJ [Candidatus Komeilibacteria bacterium]